MRIDKVYIEDYKNLKQFSINLDEKEMKTVLLGQNASGKSNFMEALILIFKNLDLSTDSKRQPCPFDYNILYYIGESNTKIEVSFVKSTYVVLVDDIKQSYKSFFSKHGKASFQPKYVFTYYSGLSNKLKEHFWDHQNNFYNKIISDDFKEEELDSMRKLFYVQLVHSYFVLLAYFTHEEAESIKFLKDVLNIQDIESILFVLKMPTWAKNRIKDNPDDIFWTAKGLVRPFLDKLWELSLAPIYFHKDVRVDFNEYDPQEQLYLFLKGKEKLKELADTYTNNTALFKALESTYISKLIAEVKIKVRKTNVDESITFKELSEGEQQLLTVLGLMKFTKDNDSLILLDEPDTHLNPLWKWRYLEFLDKVVDRPASTQIIINTHDPLVIGSLRKEEVRIFRTGKDGKVTIEQPEVDPRGLGVEGILTSELFGLPTTIDDVTQIKLNKRNDLLVKQQKGKLTENEQSELKSLYDELEELGITNTFRDPLYQKFIVAYKTRLKEISKPSYSKDDLEKQNKLALEILEELMKEEEQ